jgi:transposase
MTVPAETEAEIRRLHFAEHWPVGTIASQLGVHEDVVKRVLGLCERTGPIVARARLTDPYVDFIKQTLANYPRLRATRVFDMVKARGYKGSVRTLREYVREVRPVPKTEAFLRIEPLVGEQAQVDWAHVGKVAVPGGQRSVWLFVMLHSWSRAMWAEFVFDTSVYSLLRSLSRAGEYFGGHCRQWLFDNPKTVVLERHGNVVRFHPLLLELASAYHVQLRVCAVRKPNQKGVVERSIRYLRDRFLAARRIVSIEQGNRDLLEFFDDIAHARPHPTHHGQTVAQRFEEERRQLLPLPDPRPPTDQVTSVVADKTAFVCFDVNRYSVPPDHAQDTLTLVADDKLVRVLAGESEVACHDRSWGKRQRIEDSDHREKLWQTKRGARASRGRDRLRAAVPQIDVLFARWVQDGRNVGNLTARTFRLLDLYGDELLRDAVSEAIDRGTSDPGALAQLCEQRRTKDRHPVPIDISLGDHIPDREVIPHDLETYDGNNHDHD